MPVNCILSPISGETDESKTKIPKTKSGKIVELAVRDLVNGKEIKNASALANPESYRSIWS